MTKLTAEQTRRINEALNETCMLLAKEIGYRADLRDQERVAFYNAHINKLQAMLNGA